MASKTFITEEQFWFTATTVGVNAFLLSCTLPICEWLIATVSVVMTTYCIYLILYRSAAHAGKLVKPKISENVDEKDKTWRHKAAETSMYLRTVFRHIPFVVCEASGSLFFVMLAGASCVGVIIRYVIS